MAVKTSERTIIIAARIRQAIEDAGTNNSELARRIGVQRRTIVRLANGHNEPDIETLEKIAVGTGKPITYFMVNGAGPSQQVLEALGGLYSALLSDLRETIAGQPTKVVKR